ncbi:ATP-grasp domain-containing protein [Shewanella sp. AC91-MNA-CIBAN-0169]|uniref:ATP-grasp domain-containing protein n=1 Tax=Shewanella sp. AC91-MNA-CIBAN-0169 TaxID=3140466 RepID=UPI00332667CB
MSKPKSYFVQKRFLLEASGSPVSAYLIKAIQKAGHTAVASDISNDCAASIFADELIIFPKKEDPQLWNKVEKLLIEHAIDIVIPSFDEMLLGWSERKESLADKGVNVLISSTETIEVFQDKWLTANFFEEHKLPCAKSSLEPIYPLVKPRIGRGSVGVYIEQNSQLRNDNFKLGDISQTVLDGEEYTVDCLFDHQHHPIYIIPRKRLGVVNGKSTGGIVKQNKIIDEVVIRLSKLIKFEGPINVQCFVDKDEVFLVEVNPRIAGGMALGFASSCNWIPLFINILDKQDITPTSIQWGMKMYRTYQEFFQL